MDLIKTTPPELGVPSHDIEWHSQAAVLARSVKTYGVPESVMLTLAKKVVQELPESDSKAWKAYLVCLVGRYLSQPTTERLVTAARHGAAHVLSMEDVALADKPDQSVQYGRGPDDAA